MFATAIQRVRLVVLSTFVLSPLSSTGTQAETWTSLEGDRSIQAKMIGMWDGQVVLQLEDGRKINVPMDKLIAASRIQAGKVAERLKRDREILTTEIKNAATKAAAAAPDPLPMPPAASTYQPPMADMTPDKAIDLIGEQFQNGHFVVIYDSLPPTYRQQLDGLVRLTLTKLDPTSLAQPLEQLHGLADLIVTRQNWILSEPRLHDNTAGKGDLNATGELVQKFGLPAAGLIRAGFPADQAGLQEIQDLGFGEWLHQRNEIIAPFAALLLQEYSSPATQWSVVEMNDDTALLEKPAAPVAKESPSSPNAGLYSEQNKSRANPTVAFQKVEGFWVPADVAAGFTGWIEVQTAALEKFSDGSMSLPDWLGGQFVTVPSVASAPGPSERPGNSGVSSYNQYDEASSRETSSSDGISAYPEISLSYESPESNGSSSSSGEKQLATIEPLAITPAMVGSILQSVGDYRSMFSPLEAATDETAFHAAAEQMIGSIQGLMTLISR